MVVNFHPNTAAVGYHVKRFRRTYRRLPDISFFRRTPKRPFRREGDPVDEYIMAALYQIESHLILSDVLSDIRVLLNQRRVLVQVLGFDEYIMHRAISEVIRPPLQIPPHLILACSRWSLRRLRVAAHASSSIRSPTSSVFVRGYSSS